MEIKVIKATKTFSGDLVTDSSRRLRVCAYARVSTDSEEQETSYESQCQHYTEYISNNPAWDFAGIYADEGITGTSTKKRDEFNRMIADCEAGKIDLVITKSVSRWARNTLDSLKYIRRLKDFGTAVYFEKEGINTLDAQGEILITIMSSLAQQESDSISQNVKMGIRFLMQQGKGRLNTTFFLGYNRDHVSGGLVIVPEEAKTVRRIYREYLDGYSPYIIAGRLTNDQVKTPTMKDQWRQSTVVSILQNEKYCGDLLLQKYYVPSFLTHRSVKNTGQLPQYFVEEAHEPIVPREVFYQVQGEMQRRSALMSDQAKLRFGSPVALSGRVICSRCGNTMKLYKNVNGAVDYRCKVRSYERKAAYRTIISPCGIRAAAETELKSVVVEAFNRLPEMRDDLIRMQGGIRDGEIRRIDQHLEMIRQQMSRIEGRIAMVKGERDSGSSRSSGRSSSSSSGSGSGSSSGSSGCGSSRSCSSLADCSWGVREGSSRPAGERSRVEKESSDRPAGERSRAENSNRLETDLKRGRESSVLIGEPAGAATDDNTGVVSGELVFLRDELDQLDAEYTQLTLERADAMNKEIRVRMLLELVDIMCGVSVTGKSHKAATGTAAKVMDEGINRETDEGMNNATYRAVYGASSGASVGTNREIINEATGEAACRDYEDFFRRTRFEPTEGMIKEGKLTYFSDDLVTRYLKEVVVLDYGYNVVFKAGICIPCE